MNSSTIFEKKQLVLLKEKKFFFEKKDIFQFITIFSKLNHQSSVLLGWLLRTEEPRSTKTFTESGTAQFSVAIKSIFPSKMCETFETSLGSAQTT